MHRERRAVVHLAEPLEEIHLPELALAEQGEASLALGVLEVGDFDPRLERLEMFEPAVAVGYQRLAKACTRAFQPDGKEYLEQWLLYQVECKSEEHYRELFRKTGLLVAGANEIPALFAKAAEYIFPALCGEVFPTISKGLDADREGYDGIILLGPFNQVLEHASQIRQTPPTLVGGLVESLKSAVGKLPLAPAPG